MHGPLPPVLRTVGLYEGLYDLKRACASIIEIVHLAAATIDQRLLFSDAVKIERRHLPLPLFGARLPRRSDVNYDRRTRLGAFYLAMWLGSHRKSRAQASARSVRSARKLK